MTIPIAQLVSCRVDLYITTLTSLAPPPNPRTVFSNLSIDFSMFEGFQSLHSPEEAPLSINQDFGELEGAKTSTVTLH